jgi:hypothetical protein
MGPIASVAVLPAASRDDRRHVPIGGLFRYLTDCWLRRCAETVERDIRWLGHDGVLADFSRASHG